MQGHSGTDLTSSIYLIWYSIMQRHDLPTATFSSSNDIPVLKLFMT